MITPVERFILYSLGEFCSQANKKIDNKPISLPISKVEFINVIKKTNMTPKKERALYRNLESLEAKKFILYENKSLRLTQKGLGVIKRINAELIPYLNITDILKTENLLKYARKTQTTLSFKKD